MDCLEIESKPKLSMNLEIHSFDSKSFLIIEKNLNNRILVNRATKQLIDIIDGRKTIEEITKELKEKNDKSSIEVVSKTIKELADKGIILSHRILTPSVKAEYLMMKIPIIKAKHLEFFSHFLRGLFFPIFFWTSLIIISVSLSFIFINSLSWNNIYKGIQPDLILYLAGTFLCSLVLHELGHATACRLFGAKHGDIGFGFYVFAPVFYADVSDVWKLKTKERVIIDLAGIYMELWFSLILTSISMLVGNMIPMLLAFFIIVNTLKNLNPFLRFDAYWVVSDLFNIPNLRSVSNNSLFAIVRWFFKKSPNPQFSYKEYLLASYAGMSIILVISFVIFCIFFNQNSIIYFPQNIYHFVVQLIEGFDQIKFSWIKSKVVELLIPLSFYILLVNVLIKSKSFFRKRFSF